MVNVQVDNYHRSRFASSINSQNLTKKNDRVFYSLLQMGDRLNQNLMGGMLKVY